ncbi:glycosyltransferase family 4 protein [Chitinophaga pinensis]|uniref:Glycosyl transferase group 1 n=1 Tax=Chitinophaga pinensis (strain ATCC 43595 / DSM 2588 / LMG 13176 / NBRC 15968 / NCIMB 11800 / UQM 2034) TaxID=485918 RepID=A0A979G0L9_CHIPD|nr:glycosyltransferase family 1 protein [Chitinophaga pinensis]ACU58541.1 glycosyl transferase group 1 [Chitinophaga pinensis DSM 2588]
MRIGVNASCVLRDTPADTGNIVRDLLLGLCNHHPEHQFILFFDQAPSGVIQWPGNVTTVVIPLSGTQAWRRYLWLEWKLVSAMKKQQLDLFLGLDGQFPLRSQVPAQLLISDMGFLHGAVGIPSAAQRFLQKNLIKYIRQAKKVIVLSTTLEKDVLQYAPEAAAKLKVLKPAVDASYHPLEWEAREEVKETYAGRVEYFAVVGRVHPRNNLLPLLKAFSALKRRLHSNMKLLLIGDHTSAGREIIESLTSYKYRNDVILLPEVDQAELAKLVAGAYALVYPPRFEGVAMPVYAAMQSEVPVIALDGAAAREAGGDAVLFADPESLEDLADKMCLLYKDEQLRSRLLGNIKKADWATVLDVLITD